MESYKEKEYLEMKRIAREAHKIITSKSNRMFNTIFKNGRVGFS